MRNSLVFVQSLAPKISTPYTTFDTGPFHKQTNRDTLLDIEDIFVFRAVRRSLLLLDVAVQVEDIDLLEAAHQGLAHAAEGRIVEPRVVGDDADDAVFDPRNRVVEEVLSIVNGLNLPAIREDLSFRQRKAISRKVRASDEEEHRLFERDPFIYFYEDYLKAYDPKTRKGRGVYYTPPPIVNFIVRAVDDILKDTFSIRDGLADHRRVTVLDFACGTGTFLLEVFQRIFDNIGGAPPRPRPAPCG